MTVGQNPFIATQRRGYGDAQDPILLFNTPFGTLDNTTFTYNGTQYTIEDIYVIADAILRLDLTPGLGADANKFTLHLGTQQFAFADDAGLAVDHLTWEDSVPNWSVGDSVELKITGPPLPNAYGYRTIWTALMTAEVLTGSLVGYQGTSFGKLTNNLIVTGRDETVTIGTPGQPRYPWTGYEIESMTAYGSGTYLTFNSSSYPSADEVAGWTLDLGGGTMLPFADATQGSVDLHAWTFTHAPGWSAGDQVLVSIRNDEVQNRIGRVNFKSRRSTGAFGGNNIVYGKTHFSPNPPMRSGLGVGTRGEGRGMRRSALDSDRWGRWRPLVVVGGADGGPGQRRWGGVGGTACMGRQSRTGPMRLYGEVG